VDIASASIPAVSSLITAIMPARCHQGNAAVRSALLALAVKSQIKPRRNSFPSVIANHSQLEERTPMFQLNGNVL
jgi:hypothetical protein